MCPLPLINRFFCYFGWSTVKAYSLCFFMNIPYFISSNFVSLSQIASRFIALPQFCCKWDCFIFLSLYYFVSSNRMGKMPTSNSIFNRKPNIVPCISFYALVTPHCLTFTQYTMNFLIFLSLLMYIFLLKIFPALFHINACILLIPIHLLKLSLSASPVSFPDSLPLFSWLFLPLSVMTHLLSMGPVQF